MLPSGENLENFVKYSSLQGKHKKKTVIFPEFRGVKVTTGEIASLHPAKKVSFFV